MAFLFKVMCPVHLAVIEEVKFTGVWIALQQIARLPTGDTEGSACSFWMNRQRLLRDIARARFVCVSNMLVGKPQKKKVTVRGFAGNIPSSSAVFTIAGNLAENAGGRIIEAFLADPDRLHRQQCGLIDKKSPPRKRKWRTFSPISSAAKKTAPGMLVTVMAVAGGGMSATAVLIVARTETAPVSAMRHEFGSFFHDGKHDGNDAD